MQSAASHTVHISLRRTIDDSYSIHIGEGVLRRLGELIAPLKLPKKCAIVTDSTVAKLHGAELKQALAAGGFEVAAEAVFPAGEASKTRETKAALEDKLFDAKLGRDTWIAALGGGVAGDMAGYTAATFMRGIPFVQIPTTLLAMVDSSVGGKTGIDTPHGKNLIGAFWQPRAVIADLGFLATLPDSEFQAGLAEVIKHGVIADGEFFSALERDWDALERKDAAVLAAVVRRNCEIKASVVERDERESDLRKILNYGHTLGHAIETAAGYQLLHGACVALGMRYEGAIAAELGLWAKADAERVERLLDRAGFAKADQLPDPSTHLVNLTRQDKKAREGQSEYVFPSKIGAMAKGERGHGIRVDDVTVLQVLKQIRGR